MEDNLLIRELQDNKNEHKDIMQQFQDFSKKLTELMLKVEGLPEKILEKADRRYASKTTERALYAFIGALSLGVVYALLRQVIK
jgi:hypothetical protein